MVFQLKYLKTINNIVSPIISELNKQAYYKGKYRNSLNQQK